MRSSQSDTPSCIQHVQGFNGQSCWIIPSDSEDISGACFVPLQKSLLENATMTMYSQAYPYSVLGTGKLISNSGFFPCLLLTAERQAHGPIVIKKVLKSANIQLMQFTP
jgi:hypothetical protein